MQTSSASRREIAKPRLDVVAGCFENSSYVSLDLAPQNAPVMPGSSTVMTISIGMTV
jgi:hypothetical protein